MLEFNYDFLDVYVDRSEYIHLEMDTDSCYIALRKENMRDAIKPRMRESYHHFLYGLCRDDASPSFLPRECCEKHKKFDRRVPGLFKTEYEGDRMIWLCSKTYVIANGDEYKFSSKGINKNHVTNVWETYENVLANQKAGSGINRGIRARNNTMFTYSQERNGFSYFCNEWRNFDNTIRHHVTPQCLSHVIYAYKTNVGENTWSNHVGDI